MKIVILMLMMSLTLLANIGNILALKGSADVKRTTGVVSAVMGMTLQEGDEIITSKKSRVQVMLKDETIVTIGASSSFSFEEFKFDGSKNSKIAMRANRGFFRSVTGKISKIAPERFKVRTASATIGIRGTDFSGNISGDREVFRCYKGAIFIEFDGGLHDIDAGMMMQILQDKYQIREFSGNFGPSSEMDDKHGFVVESIDGSEIPTEVISDITQVVKDAQEDSEHHDPENDPLSVTPGSENREVLY
jgi:hypothetical protein